MYHAEVLHWDRSFGWADAARLPIADDVLHPTKGDSIPK